MTIIEAIKDVLKNEPKGLSSAEIYQKIIENNLYQFGAKNPVGVVNGEIRRHCVGLDFPTAYPVKHFAIAGKDGKKLKFVVNKNSNSNNIHQSKKVIEDNTESLPEEKIANAMNEHLQQIKQQLLDNVMLNHPDFFEQLVVELLLKMGYGYDKNSGIVTGGPVAGLFVGLAVEERHQQVFLVVRQADIARVGHDGVHVAVGGAVVVDQHVVQQVRVGFLVAHADRHVVDAVEEEPVLEFEGLFLLPDVVERAE